MSWAADEFESLDLGDRRLNRQAVLLAERLATQPTASIPGACGGWAETQAAYRLLSDDDIECGSAGAASGVHPAAHRREAGKGQRSSWSAARRA